MNRKEKRNLIRKFNGKKGLQKKKTKGAFGKITQAEKDYKALKAKKLQKKEDKNERNKV